MHETVVRTVFGCKAGAKRTAMLFASRPQAGFPSPGDDQVEVALDLNDLLITHPDASFFVRVSGDSMQDAGIYEGDILVVDRAIEARIGSIVVAAVNGELVVKRVEKKHGQLVLVSENVEYAPILIGEGEECFVWGVVVGSVRQF